MRLKSFILVFLFANLLVTPTLLTLQGGHDISFFINLNEEENSEKNNISFGDFLVDESSKKFNLFKGFIAKTPIIHISHYTSVDLSISSPPPDFKIES